MSIGHTRSVGWALVNPPPLQPSRVQLQSSVMVSLVTPHSWAFVHGDHHQPAAEIPSNGLGWAVDLGSGRPSSTIWQAGNLTSLMLPRTGEKHVVTASHDEV